MPAPSTSPTRSALLYLLAPLPALVLGVLVMRRSDVSAAAWGQNIAACAIGLLLCLALARARRGQRSGTGLYVLGGVALGCIAATLLSPGLDDVHRWVRLGPVRLHVAAIVLPLMVYVLAGFEHAGRWIAPAVLALAAALVLFAQPDAAQATAFAAAAVIVLLPRPLRLVPVIALAAATWLRRDPLVEVAHVEGIVGLAGQLGTGWMIAALASLLLLPAPFLAATGEVDVRLPRALGAYIAVTLLAAWAGAFPVPVLGQGASPILGYLVAAGLVLRSRNRAATNGSGVRRGQES